MNEPDCLNLFTKFDEYFIDDLSLDYQRFFWYGLDEYQEFKFNKEGWSILETLWEVTSEFIKEFWENDNVPALKEDYWKIEVEWQKQEVGEILKPSNEVNY